MRRTRRRSAPGTGGRRWRDGYRPVRYAAVACSSLALLSACASGSSGLTGKTADQVLSLAVTAARGSGGFHFVDRDGSGTQVQLLVGDTGAVTAQQTLSGGGAALDIRLVHDTVYVRAGSETLESVVGLSATNAADESGKWLSVTRRGNGYGTIVATLKPDAELDSYIPQAPLALGAATTLHGIPVLPVTGTAPPTAATGALNARATLFVSTRAPYLPVGGTLTGTDVHGRKQSEVVAFTNWGEQARPAVPTGAVAVASLTG
jgi:hypothetical protein